MLSFRVATPLSEIGYAFLVLTTFVAIGISCMALLSQAVRTSPNRSWVRNSNALVIGASYVIVLVASVLFCVKRRVAVRRRLQRISKAHKTIGRNDVPRLVHQYISQEYIRTCFIAYESLPTGAFHEGWGRPGTKYEGIRFRRALLDTIPDIDKLAHSIIPSHPALKPHARMLHHFRFILPLLPRDEDGMSFLHYYDAAIQLARNSSREPTEREFELGMQAADDIITILDDCRVAMMEDPPT